jgi:hypothetical protein
MLGRLDALRDAVKLAREEANTVDGGEKLPAIGKPIFDFILGNSAASD